MRDDEGFSIDMAVERPLKLRWGKDRVTGEMLVRLELMDPEGRRVERTSTMRAEKAKWVSDVIAAAAHGATHEDVQRMAANRDHGDSEAVLQ